MHMVLTVSENDRPNKVTTESSFSENRREVESRELNPGDNNGIWNYVGRERSRQK